MEQSDTYLEKYDHAKNLARFYHLSIMPNLFGEWTLCRQWGRIGHAGQSRLDLFANQQEAQNAFDALRRAKLKRNYTLT
ncbi:WGR domain-containing protein [Shimia sp. R11_0]|nr:WGR domain-containing protein [Shimia sp. R11_0]MBO9479617.1 WGR domain-containing protein [Shimia sp. R11_0]